MRFSSTNVQLFLLLLYGKMMALGLIPHKDQDKKCTYYTTKGLLTVACKGMDLKEVPKTIKGSVDILDLQYNRIRWLDSTSFKAYTDIKSLFLAENMIQTVEPGTFQHLTKLEEIDLAYNSLTTIPMELFSMRSLRNIYIDSNYLKDLDEDMQALEKPIQAPLEYINIANCRLKDIPNFGILPKLKNINASMNPLTDLSLDNFANMCKLVYIDLTKSNLSPCTCKQVNSIFLKTGIDRSYIPVCPLNLDDKDCLLPYNNTLSSETYQTCVNAIKLEETKSRILFAAGCCGGFLIVVIVVWCCVRRNRKKRQRKRKAALSRKPFVISPKNVIEPKSKSQEAELLDRYCETA